MSATDYDTARKLLFREIEAARANLMRYSMAAEQAIIAAGQEIEKEGELAALQAFQLRVLNLAEGLPQ